MTHVTGNIQAPQVISAHHDPDTNNGGDWKAGEQPVITVGDYTNTGNVALTFGNVQVTNPTNCTVGQIVLLHQGQPITEDHVVLKPGEGASVQVHVQMDSPVPGHNESYSFDVAGTWT